MTGSEDKKYDGIDGRFVTFMDAMHVEALLDNIDWHIKRQHAKAQHPSSGLLYFPYLNTRIVK